ncbi:MAG: ABC transporter permease [Thermoguttaceae bacterium]|nr:ABC transporter permease [Thermoguttaceae bacterium]MDW8036749.1 ABC transporter permease [Thermoguttaceae bacterium]
MASDSDVSKTAPQPPRSVPTDRSVADPTGAADTDWVELRADQLAASWREMFWELFHYRELLWQMILRDIRIRYKQAVMGFGWALLMPILVVGSGFVVKYVLAQTAGSSLQSQAVAGMAVKALAWTFFAGALGFATNSLTNNIALVTKIYFPREVFPLASVLVQAFDTSIGALLVLVAIMALPGVGLSWTALWAFPLVILLMAFTTAIALVLSCANVFFRDVKYIAQLLITFGIFFTPVFYETEMLGPTGSQIMMLNPLAPLLEGLRLAVVEHHGLLQPMVKSQLVGGEMLLWHPGWLLYSAFWAIGGLVFCWRLFHRLEFLYAEYI